ncbi:MAG: outer membrane protein [Parcubacteria group bacterium Gr01-1014_56]|nr:MAG: outer membrane protein [Parcubacteria group bacterium Gr01-1014_56]
MTTTTKRTLTQFLVLTVAFAFALSVNYLHAWTSPPANPPNNNVAAPINEGTTSQTKNGILGVNALAVFGDLILSGTTNYLNFGTVAGSSGYGLRNNSGTVEYKNSGGSWAGVGGSSGGSGGSISTSGGIPAGTTQTITLTSDSLIVQFFGPFSAGDMAQTGGFIVKQGGIWKAYLSASIRYASFDLTTTEQCLLNSGIAVVCARLDAGNNMVVRTGIPPTVLYYFVFDK